MFHRSICHIGFLLGLGLPTLALAHPGSCDHGFDSGLAHPFIGIDHLLAMLAVGWWSAITQHRRWWIVPLVFVACTFFGALLGLTGAIALPASESMIALSLIVLGGLLLGKQRLPLLAACGAAGGFALFHGYAHGLEMPACGMGGAWLTGMVTATALLHLGGALAGILAMRYAHWTTRAAGAFITFVGAALLVGGITA